MVTIKSILIGIVAIVSLMLSVFILYFSSEYQILTTAWLALIIIAGILILIALGCFVYYFWIIYGHSYLKPRKREA